jgi:hypothetical protein
MKPEIQDSCLSLNPFFCQAQAAFLHRIHHMLLSNRSEPEFSAFQFLERTYHRQSSILFIGRKAKAFASAFRYLNFNTAHSRGPGFPFAAPSVYKSANHDQEIKSWVKESDCDR